MSAGFLRTDTSSRYKTINDAGMTTIEACVIIPITLVVTMLLIWLGLFFYNKNVMSHAASRAAIMGAQHPELTNEEVSEYVICKVKEFVEGKTLFLENPTIDVIVEYTEITVRLEGEMGLPQSTRMGGIYKQRSWEIVLVEKAARQNPSMFVRTVSRARKGLLIDSNQGGDNISQ